MENRAANQRKHPRLFQTSWSDSTMAPSPARSPATRERQRTHDDEISRAMDKAMRARSETFEQFARRFPTATAPGSLSGGGVPPSELRDIMRDADDDELARYAIDRARIDAELARLNGPAISDPNKTDEEFEAVVDVVSPTIDPRTRTLRVKARIDNSEGRLRPGLFARADLGVAQRVGVPVIPDIAVLQRTDGAVVFTFDPATQRVTRRVVEIGGFQEGKIEIAAGLQPGELVLTRGHQNLVDGVAVRRFEGETPSVAAQGPVSTREAAEVSVQ